MTRDDIIRLVTWTMKYHGSDAGEQKEPGSKLQSQAEHIADVMEQYLEAQLRIQDLDHVSIRLNVL